MGSVKIVLVKNNKEDSYGYLKLRVIDNRKVKLKSLGIKLSEKDFNNKKQRVRASANDSDAINNKIEEELFKLSQYNNQLQAIQSTSKTVLKYYDEIISITINSGTKLKYIGIRNKFEKYLKSIDLNDLKFDGLTQYHIQSFYKAIRESGCSRNTANYNIKSFKSLVNKAINNGFVRYYINPFDGLKLTFDNKQKEALSEEDIHKIVSKSNYKDLRNKEWYGYKKYRRFVSLEEIATIFLFQFNMQGMRCSDMQLLRWSNFKIKDGLLMCNYTMRKTGKEMTIRITPFALECMRYSIFYLIPEIEEIYLGFLEKKNEIVEGKTKEELTDIDKKELEKLNVGIYEYLGVSVHHYAKELDYRNQFVFPFLNPDDFSEYFNKPINYLNDVQYKRLTGTRHYYNQMLKKVQKQNDILTNITSHTARHSYTTILIENDVSLTEISATLGHKHIATTQSYISRLNISNIYDLNEGISKMFYN
jgi:integrase